MKRLRHHRCTASLLAAVILAPAGVRAGSLDRFEKAHRPKTERDDEHEDEERPASDDEEGRYRFSETEPSTDKAADSQIALLALCMLPPITLACFHPSFRPNRRPYSQAGLYLRPHRQEVGSAVSRDNWYHPEVRQHFRTAEFSLSGFRAFDEQAVYGHELKLQVFPGMLTLRGSWEHFYEELDSGAFDHLNFYRLHLGANITGRFIDGFEWYLMTGALVLHGEDFTPAFEVGSEMRLYPAKPLALQASATLSIFELGPVLLDTQLQGGITVGPFEIRGGPRVLYQGDAEGFWGPSASALGRF